MLINSNIWFSNKKASKGLQYESTITLGTVYTISHVHCVLIILISAFSPAHIF